MTIAERSVIVPEATGETFPEGTLRRKDILSLRSMARDEIEAVLRNAISFRQILDRPIKKVPTLRGKSVVTVFYENSTRTRASFEYAAKMMSADAINISASSSSVQKGESLKDTALTLEAMGMDMIVIRHPNSGAAEYVAKTVRIPVVNAGDGTHEHPTQGLLDLFTLQQERGRIEGLKVLIVGDIAHSRVARSNIYGLLKLGAEVRLCGPATLLPIGVERMGGRVYDRLDEAIEGVDVVNVLRIQLERQEKGLFPTLREYSERWGISPTRLERAGPGVTVMHPGPMNRGLEISAEVADAGYSVITTQVTNGVAVRAAILYMLLGAQGAS
jgi:aspartate carbamoyltransferase catalytic subunit